VSVLRSLRTRAFSSPRFQRWAARFALTRPIARRHATALFDLTAGFVYSQVLFACVQLDLFEALRDGPRSARELAADRDLTDDAMRRLLRAAASLELVEPVGDDRWDLAMRGAMVLGNPAMTAMVEHHALLYRDLSDPVALLRGQTDPELARFWRYDGRGDAGPYSALMAGSVGLLAEDVVEAYPFDRHRRLLDVGGGEGAFAEVVARRAPALKVTLFDLPPVAERARERLAPLSARVEVRGGDAFRDPLPRGHDVVSLVRVLHDHDDDAAVALLRAAREALAPGGRLVVAEPMSGTPGAERVGEAYFGLYLLAMGQGRPRTAAQNRSLLERAGFSRVRAPKTRRPIFCRLLVAEAA